MKHLKNALILFSCAMFLCSCSTSSTTSPANSVSGAISSASSVNTPSSTASAPASNSGLPADALNRTPIAFELKDVNGNAVKSSSFNGKPTVLNFFATWCGPCQSEMAYFASLEAEFKDKINVVYINTGDDATSNELKEFFSDMKLTYTNLLIDKNSSLINSYSFSNIPVTIILDSNGVIRKIQVGAFPSYQILRNKMVQYGQLK